MKISTILYTFRQGLANIFRNKWYSLASIATIAACLFLFSVFYTIVANFQHMVLTAQENVSLTVFFDEGITDLRKEEIGTLIQNREEVSAVTYTSEEQAWEDYKQVYFGDKIEEFEEGFPDNPLIGSDNYEVFLSDVALQDSLKEYISSIEGVRKINSSGVANILGSINSLIGYVSLGIIVILFFVSIFLISNTVTIGIAVRKEEITIMKYIGANDFFIRVPFIIEGMLIGLVGAALPLVIVYNIYNKVLEYVTSSFVIISEMLNFLPIDTVFDFLLPVSLLLGVGIGFLGSIGTVRKHLYV